jgi:hypothetical protein
MIIPAIELGETAISVIFHKQLDQWSADDCAVILRRLREYMRDHSHLKRPRKRRLKVVK